MKRPWLIRNGSVAPQNTEAEISWRSHFQPTCNIVLAVNTTISIMIDMKWVKMRLTMLCPVATPKIAHMINLVGIERR